MPVFLATLEAPLAPPLATEPAFLITLEAAFLGAAAFLPEAAFLASAFLALMPDETRAEATTSWTLASSIFLAATLFFDWMPAFAGLPFLSALAAGLAAGFLVFLALLLTAYLTFMVFLACFLA